MGKIKYTNHELIEKYHLKEEMDLIDKESSILEHYNRDDPKWKESKSKKDNEFHYLDLNVKYDNLSQPRDEDEMILYRKRFYLQFGPILTEDDVSLCSKYMNISKKETIKCLKKLRKVG